MAYVTTVTKAAIDNDGDTMLLADALSFLSELSLPSQILWRVFWNVRLQSSLTLLEAVCYLKNSTALPFKKCPSF
jgi:hypothetical protein